MVDQQKDCPGRRFLELLEEGVGGIAVHIVDGVDANGEGAPLEVVENVVEQPRPVFESRAQFQSLVEQGFYDGLPIHRVVGDFLIQGGDPAGDGTGGPGYSIDEKPPPGLAYTEGTVAMAKTAAEPPGRSGSQFFIAVAADIGLTPDYALVGEVTEGMDVVKAISELAPDGGDGQPSTPVVIESAKLEG